MNSAEVAQGGECWQVGDANVDLGMNALVVWIIDENDIKGHFIENGEH